MNILQILKQLRDDIKAWVTNNLNALNAKIDEKTIPIDSELDENSVNPVQNKAIATEIADINNRVGNTPVATQISDAVGSIPKFSGDYNDLVNAPDIVEDEKGNIVIADELGNVIFKVDANGTHTTDLFLNDKAAATEEYVDNAVASIEIPEVDFTGYATEDFVTETVSTAKAELSETIVSEDDNWTIADSEGNIILAVNAEGIQTTALELNGKAVATEEYVNEAVASIEIPDADLTGYATEQWVEDKNYLTEHQDISGKSDVGHTHSIDDITDFEGYATEDYVDTKVADLVNSAPEALDTLGELATALENHEDAYDALLETIGNKATYDDLDVLKEELSQEIATESEELYIADGNGNIVFKADAEGIETTVVTARQVIANGVNVGDEVTNLFSELSMHTENSDIHVTLEEKEAWDNKSDFSGSYNDLTDKPEEVDLSDYYTKTEVDTAIENVEVDLTNYYTKEETDTALDNVKEELSEGVSSESEEFHITDEAGNIILTVDSTGAHTTELTLNGETVATESYVNEAIAALDVSSGVTEEFLESLDYRVDFVKDALVGGSSVPWAADDQAAACTTIGALPKPATNPTGSALLQCTYSPLNNSVTYGYVAVGTNTGNIVAYQSNSTDMSVMYGANCTLYVDTPTGNRHAANKQYVDNAINEVKAYIDQVLLGGKW